MVSVLKFKFPTNLAQLIVPKMHVIMLMLQRNQACNTDHIRLYDKQRFILDVDIFV